MKKNILLLAISVAALIGCSSGDNAEGGLADKTSSSNVEVERPNNPRANNAGVQAAPGASGDSIGG